MEPDFSCHHGPNIQIGPGCLIISIQSPQSKKEWRERLARALPVTIGSYVALGARVTFLPGMTIGDNVIVEGGAVVVSDLPENCVAAGIPARKIADLNLQN